VYKLLIFRRPVYRYHFFCKPPSFSIHCNQLFYICREGNNKPHMIPASSGSFQNILYSHLKPGRIRPLLRRVLSTLKFSTASLPRNPLLPVHSAPFVFFSGV